jgi:hypothetical protein
MVAAFAQQPRSFSVRYVSGDVVYLQGGSAAGLREGMHLVVKRPRPGESSLLSPAVAELVVISVASTSAACEIVKADVALQPGDEALVSPDDVAEQTAAATDGETFAQVVEFTGGDPLEDELRENVPKAKLREVNRLGGRIGFEQDSILDRTGLGQDSHQQGITFRFDFTRIGNSHWNLAGYWRARISARKRSREEESLTDVLQRVYQFGLRYENPQSRYTLGLGRIMVPWASSLSTLDGGYFGIRLGKNLTTGAFAGSTPDPTAWSYDPARKLGGAFASVDMGNFERVRYTLTGGVAVSRLHWKPERQFLFVENGILVGRKVTIHQNLEADYRSLDRFASDKAVSLTRSFSTIRVQPVNRLSVDLSHNYFRVLPTPDERLIPLGQLDNLLFRGLNAGARLELPLGMAVYASGGQSSRSEDREASRNRMAGLSARIPGLGMRAEGRVSRFSGTVGTGDYRSVSLRKDSSDRWRLELEAGDQRFDSLLSAGDRTWYGMGSADLFVGHFVLGFRGARYRGATQKYDQLRATLDFRF